MTQIIDGLMITNEDDVQNMLEKMVLPKNRRTEAQNSKNSIMQKLSLFIKKKNELKQKFEKENQKINNNIKVLSKNIEKNRSPLRQSLLADSGVARLNQQLVELKDSFVKEKENLRLKVLDEISQDYVELKIISLNYPYVKEPNIKNIENEIRKYIPSQIPLPTVKIKPPTTTDKWKALINNIVDNICNLGNTVEICSGYKQFAKEGDNTRDIRDKKTVIDKNYKTILNTIERLWPEEEDNVLPFPDEKVDLNLKRNIISQFNYVYNNIDKIYQNR